MLLEVVRLVIKMPENGRNFRLLEIDGELLQKSDKTFRLWYLLVGCSVGALDRDGWFVG